MYDIADLYKVDFVVPAAFEAVSELPESIEAHVRAKLRGRITRERLLERMVNDLHDLMGSRPDDPADEDDPARPGDLWDPEGDVEGGVAYDGDHSGKGAAQSEG